MPEDGQPLPKSPVFPMSGLRAFDVCRTCSDGETRRRRGSPAAQGHPMLLFFAFFFFTKGIGRIRQGRLAFASKARKTLGEEGYDVDVERNDDLTSSLGDIGTVATSGAKCAVRLRQALGRPDGQMMVKRGKTAGLWSCAAKVPQLGHWCRRHLELENQ